MVYKVIALLATVLALFSMTLFLLASLPLLVLKHDTPMDARFVRGLFNLYYAALATAGVAGAVGYGLLGNHLFSAGMATLALVTLLVRHWMLARMDAVRSEMTPGDAPRIRLFRRLHAGGMAFNAITLASSVGFLQQLAI